MNKKPDATQRKTLVVDPIHEEAVRYLSEHGFNVKIELFPDPEKLVGLLQDYDILICRTNTKLPNSFFAAVPHLTCVALASTGYDQIDLAAATKHNTAIIGLPSDNKNIDIRTHGNFISTAEHTILMILAVLGNYFHAADSMKNQLWEKPNFMGTEANKKTLGIIGLGRIGKLVAARAQAFGMKVIAYDPYVSREEMSSHNTDKVSFDKLCAESDVISIHTPKTPETTNMIDANAFAKMKDGVFLVNAARSEVVDTPALINALNSGKVARAALDVFKNEPYEIEWELVMHDNVIPTPHIAGSTHEALRRISLSTVQSLVNFIHNGDDSNVINKTNPT
jgi:D-3-phosphoglycerate dehydrogenase